MSDPQEGPWSRLDREVLVENPWHRYCRDRYRLPDGGDGTYFYVDMAGSCGVVPLFADGTVALLRVHRYLLGETLWEWPIGGMAPGEEPVEVARKELREEAGLTAATWDHLGTFAPYKGVSNERCHFFLARDLTEVGQELEDSEQISVHRMPLEEAIARLEEASLGDGQSLVGTLYLKRWLQAQEA